MTQANLTPPPSRAASVWALIAEPRVVTVTVAAVYALLAVAGIVSLVAPPVSVEDTLGGGLTAAWGLLLAAGGTSCACGALPGWWYLERAGICASITGLCMYVAVIAHLQATSPGSRWVQGLLACALAGMLVNRWARISSATLDPSRITPSSAALASYRPTR